MNRKMFFKKCLLASLVALFAGNLSADEYGGKLAEVRALGQLTKAPAYRDAEGYAAEGDLKAIFYDALPYRGKPTKVFAWLGLPETSADKVPGIVLVHGGGQGSTAWFINVYTGGKITSSIYREVKPGNTAI